MAGVSGLSNTVADNVYGTTLADDPPGGMTIGAFVSSSITAGQQIGLTQSTTANVASIVLQPGDWDISGTVNHSASTNTSVTSLISGISTVSAVTAGQAGGGGLGTDPTAIWLQAAAVPKGIMVLEAGPVRFNTTLTTTMYLVALDSFTVSTLSVFGTIRARRMR